MFQSHYVILAYARIQAKRCRLAWIPAFAGMTGMLDGMFQPHYVILAYARIQAKAVLFGMDSGFRRNDGDVGRPVSATIKMYCFPLRASRASVVSPVL